MWRSFLISYLILNMGFMKGCTIDDDPPSTQMITLQTLRIAEIDQWHSTPPSLDVLSTHHSTAVECEDGWWIEDGLIEVSTQACNYFSVSQPLLYDLASSMIIKGGISHDVLTSLDQPTQAHIALVMGQFILWETKVAIPSQAQYIPIEVHLEDYDLSFSKGDLVTLHLHNHGANQWRWLPLKAKATF